MAMLLTIGESGCSRGDDRAVRPTAVCERPPAGLRVPFRAVRGDPAGRSVRWPLGSACIPTTIAPSMQHIAPLWREALEAWSHIACSRLCFGEPTVARFAPERDDDRRLHLAPASSRPDLGGRSSLLLSVEPATLLVRSATIVLDDSIPLPSMRTALHREIGHTLGLANVNAPLDSVMSLATPRPGPTTIDATSVCALYGPQCADVALPGAAQAAP